MGSSGDPCSDIFRGPSSFSEQETQAIKSFIELHHGEIKVAYNFHAFGNYFLHPLNSAGFLNRPLF
jgi:hypothetical protein